MCSASRCAIIGGPGRYRAKACNVKINGGQHKINGTELELVARNHRTMMSGTRAWWRARTTNTGTHAPYPASHCCTRCSGPSRCTAWLQLAGSSCNRQLLVATTMQWIVILLRGRNGGLHMSFSYIGSCVEAGRRCLQPQLILLYTQCSKPTCPTRRASLGRPGAGVVRP